MSKILGVDLGTMFFQTAEESSGGNVSIKTMRNAFVEIAATDDIEDILKQNSWQYVKDGKHYYVLGEDSLRVANMFPGKVELRRPLQDGVLNKGEEKKMLVLSEMIKNAIGKAPDKTSVVCTCVSSPSVDDSPDSAFHKARISGMLQQLGYNVKVIEEGHAVVLGERPSITEIVDGKEVERPYSGIGISFGAGRVNCVLAYKGLQVLGMSAARSGDWIDQKVSEATGAPISQVTKKKEVELDFGNLKDDDDIIFALNAYYTSMIEFVFSKFSSHFQKVKSQFEAPLEVVVAGGTSMPKGFCDKVSEVISSLELPFVIKSVRHAKDPRNAVVKGCLTYAASAYRKMQQSKDDTVAKSME